MDAISETQVHNAMQRGREALDRCRDMVTKQQRRARDAEPATSRGATSETKVQRGRAPKELHHEGKRKQAEFNGDTDPEQQWDNAWAKRTKTVEGALGTRVDPNLLFVANGLRAEQFDALRPDEMPKALRDISALTLHFDEWAQKDDFRKLSGEQLEPYKKLALYVANRADWDALWAKTFGADGRSLAEKRAKYRLPEEPVSPRRMPKQAKHLGRSQEVIKEVKGVNQSKGNTGQEDSTIGRRKKGKSADIAQVYVRQRG
jgi:hypothetical protein